MCEAPCARRQAQAQKNLRLALILPEGVNPYRCLRKRRVQNCEFTP
jgi:hypothetical protein